MSESKIIDGDDADAFQLTEALSQLAALREELAEVKSQSAEYGRAFNTQCRKTDDLQQRLADAERRNDAAEASLKAAYDWGYGDGQNNPNGYANDADRNECAAALNPKPDSALTKPEEASQ